MDFFGRFFEGAQDAAELGRIGRYYAVEDMLTEAPTEKYGKTTLRQHYERISVEGQEYDPYTTMLAKKKWMLLYHDEEDDDDDDGADDSVDDDDDDEEDDVWWWW